MHKHRFAIPALALSLAALATAASAGQRAVVPVTIDFKEVFAVGVLADARSTPDANQYIGCETTWTRGSCIARDANGMSVSCSTRDPDQLAIMRSLGSESFLIFGWNKDGTCSNLQVYNSSAFVRANASDF